ncbi:MAG: hypothetical protein QXM96_00320 [Candidatus Woesearchaeota archaeon]
MINNHLHKIKKAIKNLNDVVNSLDNKSDVLNKNIEIVENIIKEVCNHFKINKKQLIYSRKFVYQRDILNNIIYNELKILSIRQISTLIYSKINHGNVFLSIKKFKNLNTKLVFDKKFLDDYTEIVNKLKNKKVI